MPVLTVLIVLHILSAVVWVGGMFFAYVCLRPVAATQLEPPQRLLLWSNVFKRFFIWVWTAIILLIITGHTMIAQFGGMANVGVHIHIMLATGYLMMALFMHVYFAPYKRLARATATQDWQTAGQNLNQIRRIVAINLTLGLLTVVVAAGGRYGF